MKSFPTYTILPARMRVAEIAKMARARGQMVITNGRSTLLSSRILPGYCRVHVHRFARAA